MPRLGEDPNIATAYPNRLNTNLRGSWMRQCINTLVGSLLVVFVFNKLIKTNYKDATKQGMTEKGMEDKIDQVIPKTPREKQRDAAMAKMTQIQKMEALQYEVGNLTNSVIEIQQVLVEKLGATLDHIVLQPSDSGDKSSKEANQDGGNGGGDRADGDSKAEAEVTGGGGGLRGAEDVDPPASAPIVDAPDDGSPNMEVKVAGEGGDARRLLSVGERGGVGGEGERSFVPPQGEGRRHERRQRRHLRTLEGEGEVGGRGRARVGA